MRNMMIVASLWLGLTGCGKKDGFDEMLSGLDGLKSKMCACKDKECTDKVQDEWRTFRKSMKEKIGKDKKPSAEQDEKGRKATEEMRTCRRAHDKPEGGEGGSEASE